MARVLVVDDEKSIRTTLSEFLKADGHSVSVAENAETACDLASRQRFDVVITDVLMPGASGVELLQSIRRAAPEVRVIMMSGAPTLETATEAVRAGAADYLWKPVTREAILQSVEKSVREKHRDDANKEFYQRSRVYQLTLEQLVDERARELIKTNAQLHEVMEGVIQTMTVMVEMRDAYTAGHQKRVAELGCAIGRELGLDREQIVGIRMAGLIHDLGKIVVPAEILCKPGRISAEERAIIRNHAQVGYEILKNINFPWPVAQAVLQHHERLDGSGYPNRLSGDEILLEAKIIGVSDVVEAMAAHRPYRPAVGLTTALLEITQNKGTLYDSQVVEACVSLFSQDRFHFEYHAA
jgi:putative two-component system response regulator